MTPTRAALLAEAVAALRVALGLDADGDAFTAMRCAEVRIRRLTAIASAAEAYVAAEERCGMKHMLMPSAQERATKESVAAWAALRAALGRPAPSDPKGAA